MTDWVKELFLNSVVSEKVPKGQVWLVTPGHYTDVIDPQGTKHRFELEAPKVVKITGVKEEEDE